MSPSFVLAAEPAGSTLKVSVQQQGNQRIGTAFYVHPNVLATSYRLIRGAEAIKAFPEKHPLEIQAILGFYPGVDLAFLYMPVQGSPLPLGDEGLEQGIRLQGLGYAKGKSLHKEPLLFQGWKNVQGVWHLAVVGHMQPGMNGGPVLDQQGKVVGMIRGRNRTLQASPQAVISVGILRTRLDKALTRPRFLEVADFGRRTRIAPALQNKGASLVITDQ